MIIHSFTVSPEGGVAVSPIDIISSLGDSVTLVCTAKGGPNNSFVWERDGKIIANDSIVHLVSINASDGGNYTCTVSNAAGTDSTSTILYIAPYVVTPLEEEILTFNGSNVNLNCDATGFPIPSVYWIDSQDVRVSSTSQLQFSPVMFGEEGLYRCIGSTTINGSDFTAMNETTLISKLHLLL